MDPLKTIYTSDTSETEAAGAALATEMLSNPSIPRFIALYGDLGVGKTAFVRGFASVVAPNSLVRSPTFALVNEYRSATLPLFHFDMYRIDSEDDLISIGYDDYLNRHGVCLVEWSEKIPDFIPEEFVRVTIVKNDPQKTNSRVITFELVTEVNA